MGWNPLEFFFYAPPPAPNGRGGYINDLKRRSLVDFLEGMCSAADEEDPVLIRIKADDSEPPKKEDQQHYEGDDPQGAESLLDRKLLDDLLPAFERSGTRS